MGNDRTTRIDPLSFPNTDESEVFHPKCKIPDVEQTLFQKEKKTIVVTIGIRIRSVIDSVTEECLSTTFTPSSKDGRDAKEILEKVFTQGLEILLDRLKIIPVQMEGN